MIRFPPSLDFCDHQHEDQEKMKSSFYTSEYRPNIERDWSKMFTGSRSISSILARFDDYFGKYPWYVCSMEHGVTFHGGCAFLIHDNCPDADNILEATHIINGKEASIKRILYICNIPETATAEELISTFSEFGKVEECEYYLRFRTDKEGRLFAIMVFDSEKVVDELAARGKIEFRGEELEVKKVEVTKVALKYLESAMPSSTANGPYRMGSDIPTLQCLGKPPTGSDIPTLQCLGKPPTGSDIPTLQCLGGTGNGQ